MSISVLNKIPPTSGLYVFLHIVLMYFSFNDLFWAVNMACGGDKGIIIKKINENYTVMKNTHLEVVLLTVILSCELNLS